MKQKLTIIKLLLIVFIFVSCSKENINNIASESIEKIPNYVNDSTLQAELSMTLHLSDTERKIWEEKKGFKSFGSICNDLYATIKPENFNTIDEIKDFVAQHSEYLVLIPENNGEYTLQTKAYNNPWRYLVNGNKKMQMENDYYLLMDNEVVSAKTSEVYTSFYQYGKIDRTSSPSQASKSIRSTCSPFADHYDTKDRTGDRTVFEITTNPFNFGTNGSGIRFIYRVQPFKRTLGVWFQCSRKIFLNLSFKGGLYGYNLHTNTRIIPFLYEKNYTSVEAVRILEEIYEHKVAWENFNNGYEVVCDKYSYRGATLSSDPIEFIRQ